MVVTNRPATGAADPDAPRCVAIATLAAVPRGAGGAPHDGRDEGGPAEAHDLPEPEDRGQGEHEQNHVPGETGRTEHPGVLPGANLIFDALSP